MKPRSGQGRKGMRRPILRSGKQASCSSLCGLHPRGGYLRLLLDDLRAGYLGTSRVLDSCLSAIDVSLDTALAVGFVVGEVTERFFEAGMPAAENANCTNGYSYPLSPPLISPAFCSPILARMGPISSKKIEVAVTVVMIVFPISIPTSPRAANSCLTINASPMATPA